MHPYNAHNACAPRKTMTLLSVLIEFAVEVREDRDKKNYDVGSLGGIDPSTIKRFEEATLWPREIEKIVAGYARVAGVPPVEFWRRTLDRWEASEGAESVNPNAPAIPSEEPLEALDDLADLDESDSDAGESRQTKASDQPPNPPKARRRRTA